MIGCLWTRVRKQPIIWLNFENGFKSYNLEVRCYSHYWSSLVLLNLLIDGKQIKCEALPSTLSVNLLFLKKINSTIQVPKCYILSIIWFQNNFEIMSLMWKDKILPYLGRYFITLYNVQRIYSFLVKYQINFIQCGEKSVLLTSV